ncbi:MAG TPA: hypothetical protein VLA34_02005, partial [Candidatus Krumholzibacterium sp.]|nr:hypothetical protein [Candidatus Krumholzibacterium sp.]
MKVHICIAVAVLASLAGPSCSGQAGIDYGLTSSFRVISTSESGERMAIKDDIVFSSDAGVGVRVVVRPDLPGHEIDGIGSSFTESSAFVLAH